MTRFFFAIVYFFAACAISPLAAGEQPAYSVLAADIEQVRAKADEIFGSEGDVWVGYAKPAIQAYRQGHGLYEIGSRTLSDRTNPSGPSSVAAGCC